jgi:soluble calcium-activated nucleotidase 1
MAEAAIPMVSMVSDGNGNESNGFKCEWATVKDNHLFVGGLGKEWTTPTGEVINFNPMYVKKVSTTGQVTKP